jgi:hypothetical protein
MRGASVGSNFFRDRIIRFNGGMSGAWGEAGMIIEVIYTASQEFDDSFFFQRLTLIDICCGPPGGR